MHAILRLAVAMLSAGLVFGAGSARAQSAAPPLAQNSICLMLESAARAHDLPVGYLARLIWRESSFRAEAVGPQTRSGARAQGIAQFMPGTAAERGVLDPFDPIQALPKAAEFLAELRAEFGNLGLAAAAYNAGPRRLREWLDGTGAMPGETRSYVIAITGQAIEDWKAAGRQSDFRDDQFSCDTMLAEVKRVPDTYLAALEERVSRDAGRPWNVQLSASFSRTAALTKYANALKRFAGVIADHDPVISGSVLRSRGTRALYRVSVGAETRSEANVVCNRIRTAGGACMVLRNRAERMNRAG